MVERLWLNFQAVQPKTRGFRMEKVAVREDKAAVLESRSSPVFRTVTYLTVTILTP